VLSKKKWWCRAQSGIFPGGQQWEGVFVPQFSVTRWQNYGTSYHVTAGRRKAGVFVVSRGGHGQLGL
jgi:hypothetical protein